MNLIYMCVFHEVQYIGLLQKLITSISVFANIDVTTTHILVITSPSFEPIIREKLKEFVLPIQYWTLHLNTLMEAGYSKIQIFKYDLIRNYTHLLYLDTDILISSDINPLFAIRITDTKMYALEEGNIGNDFWGNQFFDFTKWSRDLSAFSTGVLYFKNSPHMVQLFQETIDHILNYFKNKGVVPHCLEQPFLVYNAICSDRYDNQTLKTYVENSPKEVSSSIIIYHFPGGPGCYRSKYAKLSTFWGKILAFSNKIDKTSLLRVENNFTTPFEMLTYYYNTTVQPTILIFNIDDILLHFINNCKDCSIDIISPHDTRIVHDAETIVRFHTIHSLCLLDKCADDTYTIVILNSVQPYTETKYLFVSICNKIADNGYIIGYYGNSEIKEAAREFCAHFEQYIIEKQFGDTEWYCIHMKKD